MSRSLVTGIVITLVLISGLSAIFYYLYIREKEQPLFDGIPNSAALVIEVRSLSGDWQALQETSMWQSLSHNEAIQQLNARVHLIDSLLKDDEVAGPVITGNRAALSFHHAGNHIGVMVTAQLKSTDQWTEAIAQTCRKLNWMVNKRTFEHETVLDVTDRDHRPVCSIACKEQMILCSSDGSLVEDGILKLKYHLQNPIRRLDNLTMLSRSGSSINLYINYSETAGLLANFLKNEYNELFAWLKRFANWSLLNVTLEKDLISLRGATVTDDSLFQYLDLFSNQAPVNSSLEKYLPSNTAFKIQLGFSDYQTFKNQLTEYLQQTGDFELYNKQRDSLETLYSINLSGEFESIIGEQVVVGSVETTGNDLRTGAFACIQTRDVNATRNLLESYSRKISQRETPDTSAAKTLAANKLPFGNFLHFYFGGLFDHIQSPYYVLINDVLVLAENPALLNQISNDFSSGNTLEQHPSFATFKQQTGESYNLSVFINTSAAFQLPSTHVSESFYSLMNRYGSDFRKFEMVQLHFATSSDKSFYTQLTFLHNAAFKEETRLLWTTNIDTSLAIPPSIIYNNTLNQNCLLVQDVSNNLYCITQTGAVLWRTKLSGKILSSVYSVYPDKTGIPAYLFNTATQTCLINASGMNLYGYPVRYPVKTASSLYYNFNSTDSTSTWYVSFANNRIAAFGLDGKPLKGWNQKALSGTPLNAPAQFTSGLHKIIYATDLKGSLILLSPEGNTIVHDIPKCLPGSTFIINQKDTSLALVSAIDSSGILVQYELNSQFKQVSRKELTAWGTQPFEPLWYSPENQYYLLRKDSLSFTITDALGAQLFTKLLPADSIFTPQPYMLISSDGKLLTAYADTRSNQIYLFDLKGMTYPGFPLQGNSVFSIIPFTSETERNLIVSDNSNKLRVYRLK